MPAFTPEQIERSRRRRGKSSAIQAPAIQAPAIQAPAIQAPAAQPGGPLGTSAEQPSMAQRFADFLKYVPMVGTPELARQISEMPAGRYADRFWRTLGIPAGTAISTLAAAADPSSIGMGMLAPEEETPKAWLQPGDPLRVPEAAGAFLEQAQQGEWDAGMEAFQDAMRAGPGFWGASELVGSAIPTGGAFVAGGKLISSAPRLAATLAGPFVPATRAGVGVKRGIETGIRGTGKAMRLPWQAEEAIGSGALGLAKTGLT